MKKKIIETVRLDKIVPGGQSIGILPDGRKIFVWGALPNETARVELTKMKKSYAEGIAIEILESASERIAPRDHDAYLSTSPWQVMNYRYELQQKSLLIKEAFAQEHIAIDAPEIITDSQEFSYRNKMEYSLWWDNDTKEISLAFHKRGSHQKIPITSSSIERSEIFTEAQRIVAKLNAENNEARRYQSLMIRCNQNGKVSSALFENYKPRPVMKNLRDNLLGYEYSYSPNGFFQINLPIYEMALMEMQKRLSNAKKVVDMYAGVGTIGLSIARDRELTLVETDSNAFREMEKNITHDMKNISAIHTKSEEALEYITDDITLILDPPRAGLDEKVTARILETKPSRVIYLSCNPITQVRDIARLLPEYKIVHTQGFNFFPRTPHIENLVVLEKS